MKYSHFFKNFTIVYYRYLMKACVQAKVEGRKWIQDNQVYNANMPKNAYYHTTYKKLLLLIWYIGVWPKQNQSNLLIFLLLLWPARLIILFIKKKSKHMVITCEKPGSCYWKIIIFCLWGDFVDHCAPKINIDLNRKAIHETIDHFTVVSLVTWPWMQARLEVTLLWYRPLCFSHVNAS